jgi:hypothetical protein
VKTSVRTWSRRCSTLGGFAGPCSSTDRGAVHALAERLATSAIVEAAVQAEPIGEGLII